MMDNVNALLAWLDNKRRMVKNNLVDMGGDPLDYANRAVSRYAEENLPSRMDVADARSVMPGMGDEYQNKLAGLAMGAGPGMTVWHGSPHTFPAVPGNPLGKFDMSNIGTGEGAQTYGHGLYVGENRKTGEFYRKSTGDAPNQMFVNGERFDPSNPVHRNTMQLNVPGTTKQDVIDSLLAKVNKSWYNQEDVAAALKAAREDRFGTWSEVTPPRGGALYKVDLPDEHIAKMLDWDAPLSKQPPEVQKIVDLLGKKEVERFTPRLARETAIEPLGRDIYDALAKKFKGSKVAATAYLRDSLGIPGIKYLDGGSRMAGEGTRNFVVFDDKLLKILGRE